MSGKIRAPAQAIVEIPLFLLLGLCVVVGLGRSRLELSALQTVDYRVAPVAVRSLLFSSVFRLIS